MKVSTGIRIVKLNCVGCGANLEIADDNIERIACGHCGTSQFIERSGGILYLRAVTETLSKVKLGTDKTAAELAIARLTREVEMIRIRRSERNAQLLAERYSLVNYWNSVLKKRRSFPIVIAIATFFVLNLFIGLPVIVSSGGKPDMMYLSAVGWGCIAFAVLIYFWLRRLDKYNPTRLRAECDQQLRLFDEKMKAEVGSFDACIADLEQKIQDKYRIASS